jgi:hypothetical protein
VQFEDHKHLQMLIGIRSVVGQIDLGRAVNDAVKIRFAGVLMADWRIACNNIHSIRPLPMLRDARLDS